MIIFEQDEVEKELENSDIGVMDCLDFLHINYEFFKLEVNNFEADILEYILKFSIKNPVVFRIKSFDSKFYIICISDLKGNKEYLINIFKKTNNMRIFS